jgi:hypothetical protein
MYCAIAYCSTVVILYTQTLFSFAGKNLLILETGRVTLRRSKGV